MSENSTNQTAMVIHCGTKRQHNQHAITSMLYFYGSYHLASHASLPFFPPEKIGQITCLYTICFLCRNVGGAILGNRMYKLSDVLWNKQWKKGETRWIWKKQWKSEE